MTTLTDALSARAAARQCHQEDVEALALARDRLATSQAELDRLAAEDRAAVDRLAKRLAQQARAGNANPVPTPMPSDRHTAAYHAARITLAAATAVVADIESAHRQSRQALAGAESAVREAALAILAAEGDALAQQIIERDAETEAMRQQLVGLRDLVQPSALVRKAAWLPSDWVNTPINELASLEGAGGRHPAPMHTPLNKLGRDEISPASIDHWRARLAALLSGAAEIDEPTSAERAA